MAYQPTIASDFDFQEAGMRSEKMRNERLAADQARLNAEAARRITDEENARKNAEEARLAEGWLTAKPTREVGARESSIDLGYLNEMYPGINNPQNAPLPPPVAGASPDVGTPTGKAQPLGVSQLPPSLVGAQAPPVVGAQTVSQQADDAREMLRPPQQVAPQQVAPQPQVEEAPPAPPTIQGMQNSFSNLTLAEKRKRLSEAGPNAKFLSKYLQPMIDHQSQIEEVNPTLLGIAKVAEMPGGSRTEARIKAAALVAVLAKHPIVASHPDVKEAIATATPRNTEVVFNPFLQGRTTQMDINSLRQSSRQSAASYIVARDVMAIVEPEYKKYVNAKGDDIAIKKQIQQSILDKYIQMSINKSPTEAQYAITTSFPGVEMLLDKTGQHLKWGALVTDDVIKGIVDIMRQTAIARGSNLKQMNNQFMQQAADAGDPQPNIIPYVGNEIITSDSTKWEEKHVNPFGYKKDDKKLDDDGDPIIFDGTNWVADKSGKRK